MPTTFRDRHREAIRRTLEHRAGAAPKAGAFAEAALNTWEQVAARLVPVIGARGVAVLFSRSLHLTSTTFPWLAAARHGDHATLLAGLKARLAASQAGAAAEASSVLLLTFVELLATLIGESLTDRLLGTVWEPLPPSNRENGT